MRGKGTPPNELPSTSQRTAQRYRTPVAGRVSLQPHTRRDLPAKAHVAFDLRQRGAVRRQRFLWRVGWGSVASVRGEVPSSCHKRSLRVCYWGSRARAKEFGVLVWLPVFKSSSGGWTTALAGNVDGLTAVGSVNGVYRVQHLLTTALQSTYSEAQLSDTTIFLFDNADELGGRAQFLAAYGTGAVDSYSAYGDMSIDDLVAGGTFIEQRERRECEGVVELDIVASAARPHNPSRIERRRMSMTPLVACFVSGTCCREGPSPFSLKWLW